LGHVSTTLKKRAAPGPDYSEGGDAQMMHNWHWNDPWGHAAGGIWGGWLMFVLMIVIGIAVIVAIVAFLRGLMREGHAGTSQAAPSPDTRESPRDVLKRRYAAGEIDREDYQQRLKDL
jgi:putative membrane protein